MPSKSTSNGREASAPVALGLQLRGARKQAGLTLRALAERLGVSPSLLSQIENGKSQPSVATLYALAQTLELSIDHLFEVHEADSTTTEAADEPGSAADDNVITIADGLHNFAHDPRNGGEAVNRTELGSLRQVWNDGGGTDRVSVTTPANRTRLVMDTGVIWEQLATNTAQQLDFMEITYPPGSSSTSDERMLRHDAFEYGYVLEGEFEITLGFDVFIVRAGEAIGLNSSVPHLLRNRGTVPARGIWFVHHRHD